MDDKEKIKYWKVQIKDLERVISVVDRDFNKTLERQERENALFCKRLTRLKKREQAFYDKIKKVENKSKLIGLI